jgi:hypothetical protein
VAPGGELCFEPDCFRADPTGLILREAALLDANVEQLVVLPLDASVRVEDQVELEILRVVAGVGAPERFLQVEVPASELTLGAVPEHPDGVAVARPLEHQHTVTLPPLSASPGVHVGPGREREGAPVGT